MRNLFRSGVSALVLLVGAAALQFEPAVLSNLSFDRDGRSATIGAVRVPLWSAAFAQTPDSFSLEKVTFTLGPVTYEAKRMDFAGAATSRSDIEGVFSSNAAQPLAERLGKLSARQVAIPELKIVQKIGNETHTTLYRNVVFKDVVGGRIASAVADTAGGEIVSPKGKAVYSSGRSTMSDFDIPALVRVFETKATGSTDPMQKIHGAFSIENLDMVDPEGTVIKLAHVNGRDFLARPTKDSWSGTFALIGELSEKGKLSASEEARILSTAAELFSAFDVASVEATGVEVKASAKSEVPDLTARIGRMAYVSANGSQPADARLENMEFKRADGAVKIGTISFTGFSFASTLDALKTMTPESLKNPDPATVRKLIPTLGTMRISGLDIDIPDTGKGSDKGKGKSNVKPERVKATLKDFEVTADQPRNAVPSNIRIGLQNLAIALPPNSKEEGIRDLLDLGYRTLDMSFLLAAAWNEAKEEIAVSEFSFQGKDMGSISLTGLFGNVSKDIFSHDTALATVALVSARAKTLDLVVENKGLFERFLAKTAKEENTSQEELRATYGTAAAVALPAMIGNSEQAKVLSRAIARFVAKPGRLTINAEAKQAGGLGVSDLMAVTEPSDVLESLNVSAKAE